jgi:hypothetical protein
VAAKMTKSLHPSSISGVDAAEIEAARKSFSSENIRQIVDDSGLEGTNLHLHFHLEFDEFDLRFPSSLRHNFDL